MAYSSRLVFSRQSDRGRRVPDGVTVALYPTVYNESQWRQSGDARGGRAKPGHDTGAKIVMETRPAMMTVRRHAVGRERDDSQSS